MAAKDKDGSYIVIEPGTHTMRFGRSEYFQLPTKIATQIAQIQSEPPLSVAGAELASKRPAVDNVVSPLSKGRVSDWDKLEELMKYILVKELGVRRSTNETPALVCIPLSWSTVDVERLVQIMFETLNVPGLFIAEAPMMALFGCGLVTGLVIDIGYETTDVAAVVDSFIYRPSAQTLAIGGKHIHNHLRNLLQNDPTFMASLNAASLTLDDELVKTLMESGVCRLFNAKERTMPPLISALKRADWEYRGAQLSLGPERYQAFEFLLTGGVSVVPGLQERFENEMNGYLAASETSHEFQAKEVKYAKIPEKVEQMRPYLGSVITARSDYNEMGPSVYRYK
ncbi:actin-domain-containing protein [Obelidium mucronatum]|nr:actin-domain-containing protein [Obelidium mucronatum]